MASASDLVALIKSTHITCSVCKKEFNKPKTLLPCLHTFCGSCLSSRIRHVGGTKKKEITCPTCQVSRKVPATGVQGMPDNHLVIELRNTLDQFIGQARPGRMRSMADGDTISDGEFRRMVLSENYDTFLQDMVAVPRVSEALHRKGTIPLTVVKDVSAQTTRSAQANILHFHAMECFNAKRFDEYYIALRETGNTSLADILKPYHTSAIPSDIQPDSDTVMGATGGLAIDTDVSETQEEQGGEGSDVLNVKSHALYVVRCSAFSPRRLNGMAVGMGGTLLLQGGMDVMMSRKKALCNEDGTIEMETEFRLNREKHGIVVHAIDVSVKGVVIVIGEDYGLSNKPQKTIVQHYTLEGILTNIKIYPYLNYVYSIMISSDSTAVAFTEKIAFVFDSELTQIKRFSHGVGRRDFAYYSTMNDAGEIFVSDPKNGYIRVFYKTSERFIGKMGNGFDELYEPRGICVDHRNYLYVCDTGNYRIQVYTCKGSYIGCVDPDTRRWFQEDTKPVRIACGPDDTLFVYSSEDEKKSQSSSFPPQESNTFKILKFHLYIKPERRQITPMISF